MTSEQELASVLEYRRQWLTLPVWLTSLARWIAIKLRLHYGSAGFRFLALAFLVFIVFSGYFSYDLPGITSEDLKKEPMSLTNMQLGLLFSVYAFPNVFLPLFSGLFFTLLGVWKGVLIIGVVNAVGISIIALGVASQSFWLMLFGRAVYGLGGDSLIVGVDVLVTRWFKGKELGLAYGLMQAAGQAGSFAAFYGVPALLVEAHYGYVTAYYCGLAFAITAVVLLFMGHALEQVSIAPAVAVHGDELAFDPPTTSLDAANSALLGPGSAHTHESAISETNTAELSDAKHAVGWIRRRRWCAWVSSSPVATALGLNHLMFLQVDFWLVVLSIAAYSGSFYTFMAFGMDYLETKYGLGMEDSGHIVGIISIASCIISPISGLIMDKRGGRPYVAFVGMAGSCIAFALLGFTDAPVVPTVVFAGICYALLPSSLYPLVADFVPEEAFTQVYAIANAAVNVVLTVTMLLAGELSTDRGLESAESVELLVAAAGRRLDSAPEPMLSTVSAVEGGGEAAATKLDYFWVFALFVIYTGAGTLATGWLSLSHAIANKRRITVQTPLREHHRAAMGDTTPTAGASSAVLAPAGAADDETVDDDGGTTAMRRAGARDRQPPTISMVTAPGGSAASAPHSGGQGGVTALAVSNSVGGPAAARQPGAGFPPEIGGFGIPGMRMGAVRRGLLRVLGFVSE